jgi:hypothetical protein
MRQLSWEALEEGKSVLKGVEAVGEQLIRAEILLVYVDMQMLGLHDCAEVQV